MPPKRRQEPGSSGYYSDDDDLTGCERATAARDFRSNSPTTCALERGAEIVDEEQAKLVEALQEVFSAHMKKNRASTGVNMDDFVEANITLKEAKDYLKANFKDVLKNLDITDTGLQLILNEINSKLRSINPDIIDETISVIVNKLIPTSEIVRQATKRQRTRGGKTNRKHKTNKKHKTNRRKHKTYRRKHRKTRKN